MIMPNMQRKDHITQYTTLSTPRLFGNTVLHFLGNTSTTHLGAVCFRVVLTHIKEMKNVSYYTLMQIPKGLNKKM